MSRTASSPMGTLSANTIGAATKAKTRPAISAANVPAASLTSCSSRASDGGHSTRASAQDEIPPVTDMELSEPVIALIRENEEMISTIVSLQIEKKALLVRVEELEAVKQTLSQEVNDLRYQLGDANVNVSATTGAAVNYKKECANLQVIVDRQKEEMEKMTELLDSYTNAEKSRCGPSAINTARGQDLRDATLAELNSALRVPGKTMDCLRKRFEEFAGSSGSGGAKYRPADAADRLQKEVAVRKDMLATYDTETRSMSTTPIGAAILPVRKALSGQLSFVCELLQLLSSSGSGGASRPAPKAVRE